MTSPCLLSVLYQTRTVTLQTSDSVLGSYVWCSCLTGGSCKINQAKPYNLQNQGS